VKTGLARFDLLAAIDLRGGRVVRLREGDFARETSYSDDPVGVAMGFVERGVRWLHVVDLDGARAGESVHGAAIASIVDAVSGRAAVEVAGGLRTADAIAAVLEMGAERAVIGSAALADSGFAATAITRHGPDRIAVALDIRDGNALGHAWAADAPRKPLAEAMAELARGGVQWFEVTAIDRDGSLEGPDLELLQSVVAQLGEARIVASGGIATVEDMLATWTVGCAGAIVGRGLYEGTFDLDSAARATRRAD
jgi:phosphoribosylformimino-5-aminoimidazole carboxamide ribotide isomerase